MPYTDREQQKAAQRRWITGQRAARRAFILSFKAKPCLDCDGEFDPIVLDFHHRDETQKEFEIAEAAHRLISLDKIEAEIAKCDLICANCHRLRHKTENEDVLAA